MQDHHDDPGSRLSFTDGRSARDHGRRCAQRRRQSGLLRWALTGAIALALPQGPAAAQAKYVVKPIAELKTRQLPPGPLYWRIERFPSLEQAKAAAGPYRWNADTVTYDGLPSLTAEIDGKAWLFTLGPKRGKPSGGTPVAEIGPVPAVTAPEYLLRVNHGSGPAGSKTPSHRHPGSEAFYVLSGRLGQKTPQGVRYVEAGQTLNGSEADTTMEVFNAGTTDLTALIMFVVDATRPFSVPAKLP